MPMCKEHKFYRCKHCGNLIGMIQSSGARVVCCGEEMEELVANTVDAAKEKHVPVVTVDGNIVTVEVGSVTHPMEEKHYIQWIYLQTKNGGQRKCLSPGDEPKATFALDNDEVVAVFEYCNIHGLWKTEL
jgi:superoxide reductase